MDPTRKAVMDRFAFMLAAMLLVTGILLTINGCSVFISTPRTAKIHIQGLDNKYYDCIVNLDDDAVGTNLDIEISKKYAVQLDFEWLWDSDNGAQLDHEIANEDIIPPLSPWMLCKYRF